MELTTYIFFEFIVKCYLLEDCESKVHFTSPRAVKSLIQQLKTDEELNRIYYVRSHTYTHREGKNSLNYYVN